MYAIVLKLHCSKPEQEGITYEEKLDCLNDDDATFTFNCL